jgi:hypothetical protein
VDNPGIGTAALVAACRPPAAALAADRDPDTTGEPINTNCPIGQYLSVSACKVNVNFKYLSANDHCAPRSSQERILVIAK